jgi:AraC-like DNA-binding protein
VYLADFNFHVAIIVMNQAPIFSPIGSSVLCGVLLVDRLERPRRGFQYRAGSLPGHLLQFMLSGKVRQEMNGRRYELRGGDVAWYHEDELVVGEVQEAPWAFYTVNFLAPMLPAPPFDRRVTRGTPAARRAFDRLLRAWRGISAPPAARELRVQSALHMILAESVDPQAKPFSTAPATRLWWDIEARVRRQLDQRVTLQSLEQITGRSTATIARSCYAAVGLTPMRRLRQVRLSLAQGLLRQSNLTVSEIAQRIGYGRVHEFSRDYHKWHGVSPTQERLLAENKPHAYYNNDVLNSTGLKRAFHRNPGWNPMVSTQVSRFRIWGSRGGVR